MRFPQYEKYALGLGLVAEILDDYDYDDILYIESLFEN